MTKILFSGGSKAARCTKCGSEKELLYERDWIPVYYCPGCGTTSCNSLEAYGLDEKAIDEAGQ
tara:strand:- start:129 stop:317 length:189 start_codon:yes stop_codon:yes gene_type:complete